MDMLRDLLFRLEGSSWFLALPEFLRQPPGLYLLVGAVTLGVLVFVFLLSKLVFGSEKSGPNVDRRARKQLKRDIAELKRHGNYEELGRLYESMGQASKALRAYDKGQCHERRVALSIDLGRRAEAKKVAREAGVWRHLGELCRDDEELEEAATAFERAGLVYEAARCWDRLERPLEAARCYVAAGMEAEATKRLQGAEGREAAEILESALRAALAQGGGSLSVDLQASVRHGIQLWLAEGQAERAFRLAVDAGQLSLAVPVARDYLEPSREAAEVCARADALLVAAEIYEKLGDGREAALQRAEHHRRHGDPGSAAEQFEIADEWSEAAELWATAGQTERAARLYETHGDLRSAAALFGQAGDTLRQQEILSRVRPLDSVGDSPAHGMGAGFTAPSLGARGSTQPAGQPTLPPGASAGAITREVGRATLGPGVPGDFPGAAAAAAPSGLGASEERYRLSSELGRGGMGAVFLAEDTVLRRQVAYKVVPESILGVEVEPETLLAEARAAARLSHPNIVQVYDAGRHGKGFFVVMERVVGQNLEAILRHQRMSVAGAIRVGRQVCAALDHAHERRIIHRDLKPSNLMWDGKRARLTDFGLARAFEEGAANVATQPAGTPSYMAPEQIRGEPLTPQTDIYAFGCLLFEMLCQKPIFGTGPTSFHHHLATEPDDPRQHREDVPDALAELILRCLAKDPAERPPSAKELGRDLAALG